MGSMVTYNTGFYKNKRVLVTGDSGFKGSWLSIMLNYCGAEVVGYSLPPSNNEDNFIASGIGRRIRHIDGNILDLDTMSRIFSDFKPEIVFHLAAQSLVKVSYDDPVGTFKTNIQGSVNVLDCVRKCPCIRSFIYVTSDKCYKNKEWVWGYRENDELGGHDPYSASKAAAEIVFESYRVSFFSARKDIGVASARAGNVIGGGDWSTDRIIPDCVRALQKDETIKIRNPNATRPWQHVLEPVNGYMQLASALWNKPTFFSGSWNFGPNNESHKSVIELVEKVIKNWGSGELSVVQDKGASHETASLHLNCDKTTNYLGWSSVWKLDECIRETINWYKAQNKSSESERQVKCFLDRSGIK